MPTLCPHSSYVGPLSSRTHFDKEAVFSLLYILNARLREVKSFVQSHTAWRTELKDDSRMTTLESQFLDGNLSEKSPVPTREACSFLGGGKIPNVRGS